MRGPTLLAIVAVLTTVPDLAAQEPLAARADLIDAQGRKIGEATLLETPYSGVRIELDIADQPPGVHAFHVHETGSCEPPAFESAGGHYAPRGNVHGFLNPEGAHAGDLLNLRIPETGRLRTEQLASQVTLRPDAPNTLFDDDGSALVIHAGPDDYRSQPAG
ncbi:MAG: superoxide dismutase family protein, partial [Gemmatimonadetes bacterium]|nr:superoxide dismutase family protein [Gemmatimonadota bacterium]NIX22973.1 superoxide dismutase family protein [Actinomycetota bacterium]